MLTSHPCEVLSVLLEKQKHHLSHSSRLLVLLQHKVSIADCQEQTQESAHWPRKSRQVLKRHSRKNSQSFFVVPLVDLDSRKSQKWKIPEGLLASWSFRGLSRDESHQFLEQFLDSFQIEDVLVRVVQRRHNFVIFAELVKEVLNDFLNVASRTQEMTGENGISLLSRCKIDS